MYQVLFRLILLVSVFLAGPIFAFQSSSVTKKNWAWKPLFNHQISSGKLSVDSYQQVKQELFSTLAKFLSNEENGVEGEFISQNETNLLLRFIANNQIKAIDLLNLLQDFGKSQDRQLKDLCRRDHERCDDGRKILVSFLDVQNRVEEIESGRLDVEGLPEDQRELFLGNQFLCFYYDFQTESALEKFKQDHLAELRSFVKKVKVSQDRGLVQSLIRSLSGESNVFADKIEERPAVTEAEITSVLTGWDQRIIVARCWRKERVLQWKDGFLKTSMPEVLVNKVW